MESRVASRSSTSCGSEATTCVQPPWSLGRVSAVARRGGILYAAANPRGMQGYAAGR